MTAPARWIEQQVNSPDCREIVDMVIARPDQPHIEQMAVDVWFVDLPADVFKTVIADDRRSHVVMTYRNRADRLADWKEWQIV